MFTQTAFQAELARYAIVAQSPIRRRSHYTMNRILRQCFQNIAAIALYNFNSHVNSLDRLSIDPPFPVPAVAFGSHENTGFLFLFFYRNGIKSIIKPTLLVKPCLCHANEFGI